MVYLLGLKGLDLSTSALKAPIIVQIVACNNAIVFDTKGNH